MACVEWNLGFRNISLIAGAQKAVVSVKAPTNQIIKVTKVRLFCDGIAGDAKPISYQLRRITAGNGTATAKTPAKLNDALTATVQTTGRVDFTGTQPTDDGTNNILFEGYLHPQGGVIESTEHVNVTVAGGKEIALELSLATGQTPVNASGSLIGEE